jgi:hypothetical protein
MKKLLIVSLLSLTILGLHAQEETPAIGSDIANVDPQAMLADSISAIKASFGITTIGGETYAGFRFQPDFRFWKIGFGLDVPVMMNINTREFRTDEFKGGVEMLRLIRYFSLGRKKEDAIYVRTGDLTGVSLGYGTLINNYSNSPSFEMRKYGINADVNFKGIVGVEGIYSDIKGANLLGLRPYVRPLRTTKIPIVKSFEIGYSYVTDKGSNADSTAVFLADNGIKAMAFDAGITFLNTSFVKLIGYGQYSQLKKVKSDTLERFLAEAPNGPLSYNKGSGSSVGLAAKMNLASAFVLDARIERLWYNDFYTPQFFDAIYEINKDAKIASLATSTGKQGIYGNLAIILFQKFRLNGALLMPDDISAESPALVQVGLEAAKLGDKLTIGGHYIKGGLTDLKDAFTLDQRSLASVTLNYQLAKFFYVGADYRWTFARLEDGSVKATNFFRPYFGLSFPFGGNSNN